MSKLSLIFFNYSFRPFSVVYLRLLVLRHPKTDFYFEGYDDFKNGKPDILYEDNWVRKLVIGDVPLRVHLTFGDSEVNVTVSRSHLTSNGHPVELKGTVPHDKASEYTECLSIISDFHLGSFCDFEEKMMYLLFGTIASCFIVNTLTCM